MDKNSLAHTQWECKVSHRICAKISAASDLWLDKAGNREDTTGAMRAERDRDNGSGIMRGSCAYAGTNTAEVQCKREHGVSEREELAYGTRH